MRNSSFGSKDKSGWKVSGGAQETDPLIRSTNSRRSSNNNPDSNLRERRSSSRSPIAVSLFNQRFGGPGGVESNTTIPNMNPNPVAAATNSSAASAPVISNTTTSTNSNNEPTSSYTQIQEVGSLGGNSAGSYQNSTAGGGEGGSHAPSSNSNRSLHSLRRSHLLSGREAGVSSGREGSGNSSPLLEIPEEVYRVRRAALQVLKPLTRTWVRTNKTVIFSLNKCF
jgi:hypothetical protein